MLFFEDLHTLSLQGMQNISGFITKSILTLINFDEILGSSQDEHFGARMTNVNQPWINID